MSDGTPGAIVGSLRDGSLVPALAKAIDVIRYLNNQTALQASLHAISTDLSITKSHCHNILKTLEAAGWVSFDDQRRVYMLSTRMLSDLSRLIRRQEGPIGIHDELVQLAARVRTTCVLTRVAADGSFVVIDKTDESDNFQVSVSIGHRFEYDATAQFRVRLAWMDAEARAVELDRWQPVQRTPTSIMSRQAMEAEILLTRERGYSISRLEYTPGVLTFAAPIFNMFGKLSLILVCFGVAEDMIAREPLIVEELLRSAWNINRMFSREESVG